MEQQQKQYVQVNTNTFGLTLFADDKTILKLNFYNEAIDVQFLLPSTDENGKTMYPKDARPHFLLNKERVCSMVELIETVITDAIAAGKNKAAGPFLNNSKSAIADIQVTNEGEDQKICLRYFSAIDENRKPKAKYAFEFPRMIVIEDYDPETGEFNIGYTNPVFMLFYKTLVSFSNSVGYAEVHNSKHGNNYDRTRFVKQIIDIAQKLGLNPVLVDKGQGQGQQQYGATGSMFDPNQVGGSNIAPQKEAKSLEDLLS